MSGSGFTAGAALGFQFSYTRRGHLNPGPWLAHRVFYVVCVAPLIVGAMMMVWLAGIAPGCGPARQETRLRRRVAERDLDPAGLLITSTTRFPGQRGTPEGLLPVIAPPARRTRHGDDSFCSEIVYFMNLFNLYFPLRTGCQRLFEARAIRFASHRGSGVGTMLQMGGLIFAVPDGRGCFLLRKGFIISRPRGDVS